MLPCCARILADRLPADLLRLPDEDLLLPRGRPRLLCKAACEAARPDVSEGALRAACAAPVGRYRAWRCWKALRARDSALVMCARAPRHLLEMR